MAKSLIDGPTRIVHTPIGPGRISLPRAISGRRRPPSASAHAPSPCPPCSEAARHHAPGRFSWVTAGQVEHHTTHRDGHPSRHLQQLQPDRPGQRRPPQCLHQHVGRRGEPQPEGVGQEPVAAGPVGEQVPWLLLYPVLTMLPTVLGRSSVMSSRSFAAKVRPLIRNSNPGWE